MTQAFLTWLFVFARPHDDANQPNKSVPLCSISSRLLLGVSLLIEPVSCLQDNEDSPLHPQSGVTWPVRLLYSSSAEATDGGLDM